MKTRTLTLNKKEITAQIRSEADESVFEEIFIDRDYKLLDPAITKAKTLILDIGAHTGYFAIYASALNPTTQILSFEPELSNFKLLKENLKQNRIHNAKAKNLAVAGKEGTRTLILSEDSHNHSLIEEAANNPKETITIQTTTLDKILSNATTCDLVKMDVEGAEYEILAATQPETFAKIKTLFIEYHEFTPDQNHKTLTRTLEKQGFKTQTQQNHYDKRLGYIIATINPIPNAKKRN
jgi:FkbM family methyltransferase